MTATTTATGVAPELAGLYDIDPAHSRLGFVARHAMVTKVRGSFTRFSGTVEIPPDDLTNAQVALSIDVASVDTGNEQRDGHLRTNDFFDIERFPTMTFASTAIEALGENRFRVTGDLTIKDVTKPVTLDVELTGAATDAFGNDRIGFEAATEINRKDFGVSWNAPLEAGGVLVSEKVTLELDVSAVRKA